MHLENELQLDFSDVLMKPKRSTLSSRSEVDLFRKITFKNGQVYNGVPIIAANMDTVGTFEMANAFCKHNMMVALHKHYAVDKLLEFFKQQDNVNVEQHWYSMGITAADSEKFQAVNDIKFIKNVCIDVANGYQENFVEFVKRFSGQYPDRVIMAGNVVTGEMAEALILAGASVVKVGIGPGSVCTTRRLTGVGRPQLSAIIDCADAAHGLGGHICSDGGITVPGDLGKAFGAGADFVMAGGIFAGHAECAGEITNTIKKLKPDVRVEERSEINALGQKYVYDNYSLGPYEYKFYFDKCTTGEDLPDRFFDVLPTEKSTMKFYGMSSTEAMNRHNGGVAKYRASEGKCVEVPYRGNVEDTIQEYLGGLRSTMTYIGAQKLKEIPKRTTFMRVNNQINNVFGGS